jgi:hypothetical protein
MKMVIGKCSTFRSSTSEICGYFEMGSWKGVWEVMGGFRLQVFTG